MAYYDVKFIENFIRQEAIKRGIDPEIALRVARSEGLKENTWQSNWRGKSGTGPREKSYGPYQLLSPGGLGDAYEQKTGYQVEDPAHVTDQVSFALDEARHGGWTPWHGWKGDRWAGIRTPATANVPAGDVGGLARGAKMEAEQYDVPNAPGGDAAPKSLGDLLGGELTGDDKTKTLGGLLSELGKPPEMTDPPNVLPKATASSTVQSLPEYIQQFIAMRMRGMPGGWAGGGMGGQGGGMGGQGIG